jgi:hypothetical protein
MRADGETLRQPCADRAGGKLVAGRPGDAHRQRHAMGAIPCIRPPLRCPTPPERPVVLMAEELDGRDSGASLATPFHMLFEIVEVPAERGDRRGGTVTAKRGVSLVQDAVHGHVG